VPMVARGRTIGAVTLVSTEAAHRFDTAELALAEDLARRAALSADNARLYRQQVRVVEALQQSLLPPTLPEIPGIEVAVRYRPCGDQLEVGGDFYDVFRLNDDSWGVVIGHVCGKGAEAAAVTALARYTVRSSALHAARPSRVLGYLNDAMLMHGSDRFCTVAYGRLQLANGGLRLVVGSGGHPLPLVMNATGEIETLGEYGTLVGPFENPDFSDRSRLLRPGDVVVLHTDGITEACDGDEMLGDDGLEAILAGCVGLSATDIIDRIERAVMVMEPGARDDIALMVLKVL
jgi:serine phosphatase RsbU (regulator of sigma subunit)